MLEYGRKIRVLLAEIDMDYNDFAEEMGVHRSTVGNSWIRKAIRPSKKNACNILQFFEGQITAEDMGHFEDEVY